MSSISDILAAEIELLAYEIIDHGQRGHDGGTAERQNAEEWLWELWECNEPQYEELKNQYLFWI